MIWRTVPILNVCECIIWSHAIVISTFLEHQDLSMDLQLLARVVWIRMMTSLALQTGIFCHIARAIPCGCHLPLGRTTKEARHRACTIDTIQISMLPWRPLVSPHYSSFIQISLHTCSHQSSGLAGHIEAPSKDFLGKPCSIRICEICSQLPAQ